MRCGSVTYKKRTPCSIVVISGKSHIEEEEIAITLFLDEADKTKGIGAKEALEMARKFVNENLAVIKINNKIEKE